MMLNPWKIAKKIQQADDCGRRTQAIDEALVSITISPEDSESDGSGCIASIAAQKLFGDIENSKDLRKHAIREGEKWQSFLHSKLWREASRGVAQHERVFWRCANNETHVLDLHLLPLAKRDEFDSEHEVVLLANDCKDAWRDKGLLDALSAVEIPLQVEDGTGAIMWQSSAQPISEQSQDSPSHWREQAQTLENQNVELASGPQILRTWHNNSADVERVAAEAKIEESIEYQHSILDAIDAPAAVVDEDGILIRQNTALVEFLKDRSHELSIVGKLCRYWNAQCRTNVQQRKSQWSMTDEELPGWEISCKSASTASRRHVVLTWRRVESDLAASSSDLAEFWKAKSFDNDALPALVVNIDGQVLSANASAKNLGNLPAFNISQPENSTLQNWCRDSELVKQILNVDEKGGEWPYADQHFHYIIFAHRLVSNDGDTAFCVRWQDISAAQKVENEIAEVLEAVKTGDFSRQVRTDDKQGFWRELCDDLNEFIITVEVAINDIVRMLGAMARGDLSERITRDYTGAFGQLKTNANQTADKLTTVVSQIRASADSIGQGAREIASGNLDLSARTEQQAASLEETAASMEQMTSTVRQSASNAEKANSKATETQSLAREGGNVVEQAVEAMGEINRSSKKINDIIGVIDEIAFQTNLLALNAAVEAARAGEQGRGFAVVAGEVRNLAQRSAGAAKEIKDLIQDSVSKIDDGTSLVNQSGQLLFRIVDSVDSVTQMMTEIASAVREQTAGIEQVNMAVSQMDEMTQQNAALVEEVTAAGQSMTDNTGAMQQVVHFFSSAGTGTGPEAIKVTASPSLEAKAKNTMDVVPTSDPLSPEPETPRDPPAASSSFDDDDEWEEF